MFLFRCCIFHEYGHLHRKYPCSNPTNIKASAPQGYIPKHDRGLSPMVEGDIDNEDFILLNLRIRGEGGK